eukprot:Skav231483  [mRNA]  locus=scaffold820:70442:71743:+ [translate_table: standard]
MPLLARLGLFLTAWVYFGESPWAQCDAKPAASSASIDRHIRRYQRHYSSLRALQKRIVRPRLEWVVSSRINYTLPVSARNAFIEYFNEDELQYLSGFFDGDGCVRVRSSKGLIHLEMCQSVEGADALFKFWRCFGGGIYRNSDGCGFRRPTLRWEVTGKAAKKAAKKLAARSCAKQRQLALVSDRKITRETVQKVTDQLKILKGVDEAAPGFCMTWPYLAGFFDADGNVRVSQASNSIALRVNQKHRSILDVLVSFLHEQGLENWTVGGPYKYSKATSYFYEAYCSRIDVSRETLRRLMADGLSSKREQAEIVLQLNASNRGEVREKLSQLAGLQGRYTRLDEEGMERAETINQLRKRINGSHDRRERQLLQGRLNLLKAEHELGNLKSKCSRMISDIGRLLKEGALLKSLKCLEMKPASGQNGVMLEHTKKI